MSPFKVCSSRCLQHVGSTQMTGDRVCRKAGGSCGKHKLWVRLSGVVQLLNSSISLKIITPERPRSLTTGLVWKLPSDGHTNRCAWQHLKAITPSVLLCPLTRCIVMLRDWLRAHKPYWPSLPVSCKLTAPCVTPVTGLWQRERENKKAYNWLNHYFESSISFSGPWSAIN